MGIARVFFSAALGLGMGVVAYTMVFDPSSLVHTETVLLGIAFFIVGSIGLRMSKT